MTRRLLLSTLFLFALNAQEPKDSSFARYRLLHLTDSDTVLRRVNEAGLDGYRVRVLVPEGVGSDIFHPHLSPSAGAIVILEHVTGPLEPFHYVQVAGQGGSNLQHRLNEAGAEGFRLLPRDVAPSWGVPMEFVVLWMEKPPGPTRQHQYLVIDTGAKSALRASFNPKLWASFNPLDYVAPQLKDANQQGYRVVQFVTSSTLVMEKNAEDEGEPQGEIAATAKAGILRPYGSVSYSGRAKLQRELRQAATAGYHVADLNPNPMPFHTAVLLEKGTGAYDYLALEAKGLSALEKRLNAAEAGFRLLPYSLRFSLPVNLNSLGRAKIEAVMEKRPGTGKCPYFHYQLLVTANYEALPQQVTKAADQGYHVAGLWNTTIGEMIPGKLPPLTTPDLLILILEKPEETPNGAEQR